MVQFVGIGKLHSSKYYIKNQQQSNANLIPLLESARVNMALSINFSALLYDDDELSCWTLIKTTS